MVQQSWILLTLVGAVLIYETSALRCVVCNTADANCVDGSKAPEECAAGVTSCFLRITDGKIDRGCLVAANEAQCPLEEGSSCIRCTGEECNKQPWLQCHKCATTDATCSDAKTGAGTFCTNFKTANKCYERFSAGKVERGCESDVTPVTNNACQDNEQCKTCAVNDCNKEAGREFQVTKCVQCVSSNDDTGTCLDGTLAAAVCATPSDGKCYSKILEDLSLKRGCHSDLSSAEVTACTGTTCKICSEADGCNNGIFPDNRLQCHQCKKSDDATCANDLGAGVTKSGICKRYKADDKCYLRVNADSTFERGCQSDLGEANANVCNALSDCLVCDGNNCNKLSEQTLKDSAKCQQCDSSDSLCEPATSLVKNCANGLNDACIVRVNNGKLERGCLLTLAAADQAKCKDENDQSCVTCTGQGCNIQKWIKCHQCKESTSAACNGAQLDANAQLCPKYKADNQCYERLESEKVVRGCANDLSEAACKDNLECRTCTESACNKEAANTLKTTQRCLQCSTASDSGRLCLAGTMASQPCRTESSGKCYNKVQTDGHLTRGCQGDLTAAEITACTGDTCKICDAAECNKDVFPTNRLKCYQCKTSVDESCKDELQGTDKSGHCTLFVANDKCYSRDVDQIFERGCQSDLGLTADACKDLDAKQCKSCDAADCNAISKTKLNGAGAIAVNIGLMIVAAVVIVCSV